MKYCKQCGQELPKGVRFCDRCGAASVNAEDSRSVTTNAANSSRGTKKQIGSKTIISALLAIVFVVGGFWGWKSYGSTEVRTQKNLDLAVKYVSENDFEKAILAYNEAIKIDPKEVEAYQGLARVYTIQGKYAEAQSTYERGLGAVLEDKQINLRLGLAGMYIDKGQLANAEQAFQELINTNKNCLEAYWGLAMVYQNKGDNPKAEATLRDAVEQNPNEYRGYNTLALFLKQNNKADEAFNNLVQSLSIEINQQEAYLVLSDLYKGRWSELQAKLAAISNQQINAMLEFYSKYEAQDYGKAISIYNTKLSQQSGNQKARALVAIAMYRTGDKTGAEGLVSQLIKGKPNEWILTDLAAYYQVIGDKDQAKLTALKAVEANPTNLEAIALLQSLNTGDESSKVYAAEFLLYNWKPAGLIKNELMEKSLPIPDIKAQTASNDSKPSETTAVKAQPQYDLVPYQDKGGWGYKDKNTGEIVVQPQYYSANNYFEGRALVGIKENQFAYLDQSGQIVIGPFKATYALNFSEGLASRGDRRIGEYIDKNGKVVISLSCWVNHGFNDGLALIGISDLKWGFIDKTGQWIIAPQFEILEEFSEGLAAARYEGKTGFIDKSGNWVIQPQYDGATNFMYGLAAAGKGDKFGYIDKNGNWVIQPQFDRARFFSSDGLAQVLIGETWHKIDRTGKIID